MKFEDAIKLMREGKKVRPVCWDEGCYIYLVKETGELRDELDEDFNVRDLNGDWEEYVEPLLNEEEIIYKKLEELKKRYENPDAGLLEFAVGLRESADLISDYVRKFGVRKTKYLVLSRNNDIVFSCPNKSERQYGKLYAYTQFLTEM